MRVKTIKFFVPQDNEPVKPKEKAKPKSVPTGYISGTGKLVFPSSALGELGIDPSSSRFQIGTDEGKRKLKSLYLVSTSEERGSFSFERSGRGGYVIPLALILKNGGVQFEAEKFTFKIKSFDYEEGVTAYKLELIISAPKNEYMGKPRGRKPKQAE
ncbi:hypothetical protein [Dyadobacter sp. 32]|uniref:hypothetical protein n=1 Tax=Dyadobacter sp. 32 TaxID=538966 RepID=UPI0011ECE526